MLDCVIPQKAWDIFDVMSWWSNLFGGGPSECERTREGHHQSDECFRGDAGETCEKRCRNMVFSKHIDTVLNRTELNVNITKLLVACESWSVFLYFGEQD